ncbi:hypothetical protein LPJ61_003241, partial [Coemansia biformis]
ATEQYSLLTLLLLAAQPVDGAESAYLRALAALSDRPEDAPKIDNRAPFRRLFERAVADIGSIEWAALLQVMMTRNEAFCTYVLARTDTDTLVLPLLRQISQATAVPITAPSAASALLSATPGHGSGPRRPSAHAWSGSGGSDSSAAPAYVTVVAEPGAKEPGGARDPGTEKDQRKESRLPPQPGAAQPAGAKAGTGSPPGTAQRLRSGVQPPHALTTDNIPYVSLYLWMDILLVLSADVQFVEQLQRGTVEFWPAVPQPMHRQPQAHCIVVEMMRIFQLNLMVLKDEHLNGLALGILVNVLNRSTMVTTGIAQKLLKLFEMILRRHTRIGALPHQSAAESAEQQVYEGAMSVLLSLFSRLAYTNNPHFIYGLLQAREVLAAFGSAASGAGLARARLIAADLRVRVAYFHARVAALASPQARAILELIEAVVATETHRDRPRVDFGSRVPEGGRWPAFMLPLVWGLLVSSPSTAAAAARADAPLLEAFERLVL